jgi:hypothetical protein
LRRLVVKVILLCHLKENMHLFPGNLLMKCQIIGFHLSLVVINGGWQKGHWYFSCIIIIFYIGMILLLRIWVGPNSTFTKPLYKVNVVSLPIRDSQSTHPHHVQDLTSVEWSDSR